MSLNTPLRHTGAGRLMRCVLALMLCTLCTAWAEGERPVRSLLEIRRDHVVAQKWDTSCGAAALATLLKYQHGVAVSEKEIAEAMLRRTDPLKVKTRGGFSLLDMKRFAETRGFEAIGYMDLELEELAELGAAIVPVQPRGYAHFVVVRGISPDKVLVADPAFGNRTMDRASFERAWQPKVGFVVRTRDGAPPAHWRAHRATDDLRASDAAIRSALRP
jgi:predicted double-glycine peptidase